MAKPTCVESWIRSATTFIVFCVCSTLCHGQYVTFEVLNNAYDYAIFVGESNIVLRCCVTDINRATISIEPPNGNVLTNNSQANCLDYTIPRVRGDHGGEYKCTLHYICMDGEEVSKDLRLYINAPSNNEFPKCIRDGTYGNPYETGDWLLMSCFCRQEDSCLWSSTIPGSQKAGRVDADDVVSHNATKVVQIMVTNVTLLDNYRFDCFNIPPEEQPRVGICSIGPIGDSANDTIVSTIVMKSDQCHRPTTTDGMQGTSQSNTTPNAEAKPFEGFMIVIISVGIVVILLLATIIALLFVCSRGRRNDSVDDDSTGGYKNYAHSTDDDADKSPYYHQAGPKQDSDSDLAPTKLSSSNGTSEVNAATGHTYDSPPLRFLETTKEESLSSDCSPDNYAEIGTSERENIGNSQEEGSSVGRQSRAAYTLVVREPAAHISTDDGGDFGVLYAKVNKKINGVP